MIVLQLDLYPLSEGWIPPKLKVRDKQLSKLLDNVEHGYLENFWIYGDKGLGKTLTVTVFQRIKENVFYHSFKSRSLKDEIKKFCLNLHYEKKTYEPDDEAVEAALSKTGAPKEATIIFDDIDALGEKIKPNLSIFLRGLYETLRRKGWRFNVHLISTKDILWANEKLDEPTLSRYGFQPLHFPNYTVDEVQELLLQRLSFIDGLEYEKEAVEAIAKIVAEWGGDFREALRLTRNIITRAGKLTVEVVQNEYIPTTARVLSNRIKELPYLCALLLAAIAYQTLLRHAKVDENIKSPEDIKGEVFPVNWDDVKAEYGRLCQKYGVQKPNDPMAYYWLEQLWLRGWVDKFTLAKRHEWNYKGRRSLYVRLKVPYNHLVEAIRNIDWTEPW